MKLHVGDFVESVVLFGRRTNVEDNAISMALQSLYTK